MALSEQKPRSWKASYFYSTWQAVCGWSLNLKNLGTFPNPDGYEILYSMNRQSSAVTHSLSAEARLYLEQADGCPCDPYMLPA
jgi:hypothetical protein